MQNWKFQKTLKYNVVGLVLLINIHFAYGQLLPEDKFLPDAIAGSNYSGFDVDPTPAVGTDADVAAYALEARVIPLVGTPIDLSGSMVGTITGFSINSINGQVTGPSPVSNTLSGSIIRFRVIATLPSTATIVDTFWLAVRGAPLPDPGSYKFALVLDASGSMNANTSTGSSRWEELQNTLRSYVPSLKNWVDDTDELQVVHFQGSSGPVTYNNTVNFSAIDPTSSTANEGILFNSTSPGGSTPLGAGIDILPTFTADRHAIIVFTDGYENVCPLVYASTGITCPPPGTIALPNTDYFPIGFQGTNETLISNLAGHTPDGESAFALDPDALDKLFLRTIPTFFSGNSPRIITYKSVELPSTGFSGRLQETFKVDSLVRQLTLMLKCKSGDCRFGDDVTLKVGNDALPFPEFYSPNEIRYNITLPHIPEDRNKRVDGGGTWTLESSVLSGSKYDLSVMVEDKYFAIESKVNNGQAVYAGDPIPIRTTAKLLGEGFNNLVAEAYILRPGEDPGKLFAETNIDPPAPIENTIAPGLSRSSTVAQAKISALLARQDIMARLALNDRRIPLTRTADGTFTGTFNQSESEVASHYTLVVRYKGYHPGLDSIQGMTFNQFLVRFGRPEDIDLNPNIQYQGGGLGKEGSGRYNIQFRPVNKIGNPIGPGQAQNLRVQVNGQHIVLEDQLDGTYTAVASSASPTDKIEIFVLDGERPAFKRRYGHWGLSLHGGSVTPSNSNPPFNSVIGGSYFEGDLTYRFDKHWQLELLVGQNQFSDDFNILEVSTYLSYRFTQFQIANILNPYLKAGLGYFEPDNLDGTLGLGLRGGLSVPINRKWELYGEYGFGYAVDPELQFTKVGAGVKYFF
ncbi:MAG: outer membrane beta-barrel protein [Bacteroidota bacterium]